MKTGKVAAAVVAFAGLFYGGYVITQSEPQANSAVAAVVPSEPEQHVANSIKPPLTTQATSVLTKPAKREKLLAALAVAKQQRIARNAKASASAPQSQKTSASELPPGDLDKDYIRDQMGEIMPLVRECYESALSRQPDLEGTTVVEFSIVGEEEVGGLVEYSEVDLEESTLVDPELSECIQETMYALEFDPPKGGGRVVVRYPFMMMPAED